MKTDKAKLIQLVHIAKQQLNIDDLSYREILKRLTNKTSSTKCTVVELHKVLYELQTKGAKVKYFAKRGKKPTAYSPATGETAVKSQITHKIRAVWITMGKHGFLRDSSEQALNAYMRKIINKNRSVLVLNVGALDVNDASHILEILKKWHFRLMKKAVEEKMGVDVVGKDYDLMVEVYNETM
ncbi:gp16 family protein [Actinobacillus pleuropneumoniae]|uniref:gp16 family protein n=1 Tax=Actinobacillus pleuropneumoniae TaxID=715 RepID=UPI003B024981